MCVKCSHIIIPITAKHKAIASPHICSQTILRTHAACSQTRGCFRSNSKLIQDSPPCPYCQDGGGFTLHHFLMYALHIWPTLLNNRPAAVYSILITTCTSSPLGSQTRRRPLFQIITWNLNKQISGNVHNCEPCDRYPCSLCIAVERNLLCSIIIVNTNWYIESLHILQQQIFKRIKCVNIILRSIDTTNRIKLLQLL